MGNHPSEYYGEACSQCGSELSPCQSWNGFVKTDNWFWGPAFEFNNAEYYRQIRPQKIYYCHRCWWNAVTDEERRLCKEKEHEREKDKKHREEIKRKRREVQEQKERQRQNDEAERRQRQELIRECEENSVSEELGEWMQEQVKKEKRGVVQDQFPSDAQRVAFESVTAEKRYLDIKPVSFTDEQLQDPHFKEETYRASVENMFLKPPYQGKMFSSSVQQQIQSWLLQSFLEDENADMIQRNIVEDMLRKIQNILPPSESFLLTQAMAEITFPKDRTIDTTDCNGDTDREGLKQAINAFLQHHKDCLSNDTGISFLLSLMASKHSTSEPNSYNLTRVASGLFFERATTLKGQDWVDFFKSCQDIAVYSNWKVHEVLVFTLNLTSKMTSDDPPDCLQLLQKILSYKIPAASFDIKAEQLNTLDEKVMSYIENQRDRNLEEIMHELECQCTINKTELQMIKNVAEHVKSNMKIEEEQHRLKQFQLRRRKMARHNFRHLCVLKQKIQSCFLNRVNTGDLQEDLAVIVYELCRKVFDIFDYWPRLTQIVSASYLLLMNYRQKSHLLEIATGEGKSCVIAMLCTCLALQDKQIDVVTSSPVLARRDAKEWKCFYEWFGLTVSCNGDLSTNDERLECYKCNIVYGTVGDFAADVLRQEFDMEDVRGEREFESVIIDEVDQMTLDEGIQFTYLSHRMVGIRHLDPVLAVIWATVKPHTALRTRNDEVMFAGKVMVLFDAIVHCVDPESCGISDYSQLVEFAKRENLVSDGFVKIVVPTMEEHDTDKEKKVEALKEFSRAKMIKYVQCLSSALPVTIVPFLSSTEGTIIPALTEQEVDEDKDPDNFVCILILDNGQACPLFEMEEVAVAAMTKVKQTIKFHTDKSQYTGEILMPKFLESFVDNRLPSFVRSAFTAMTLRENREYVVKDGHIFPVDFNSTGVIEMNKKWGDGLQQFIEMKHFCAISSLSLITNFMSNLTFFKRYRNIYGVSGTIGGSAEAALIKAEYNTQVCKMPTFREGKFYSKQMDVIEGSKKDWENAICRELEDTMKTQTNGNFGRAALVICEDIETATELHQTISNKVCKTAKLYIDNTEEGRKTLSGDYGPGDVLVATNLAGRGTNVKVTDKVNRNGGLFVLVTFIPQNQRTELQVFGRTARKGAPGSAKIIAHKLSLASCYKDEPDGQILSTREKFEHDRIEFMRQNDIKQALLQEDLFKCYCQFLVKMYEKIHGAKEEEITMSALNETWGLWLQMQSTNIANLDKKTLKTDLESFLSKAEEQLKKNDSPSQNIYHVIRFGNEKAEHEIAIELYTKAITMDSDMAAIAYYNRAKRYLKLRETDCMERATKDLVEANRLLVKDITSTIIVRQIVNATKTDDAGEHFADQCQRRLEIVNAFREIITKAEDKLEELRTKGNQPLIAETAVFHLLPNADEVATILLQEMHDMGLYKMFQVKEKPVFSYSALIVTLIGVVEIAAGSVLLATGIAATFGMSLIAEGIADFIDGIKGMITGDFDWKEWAIGKAVGIAIQVATAGIGKLIVVGKRSGVAGIQAGVKNTLRGVRLTARQSLKQTTKCGIKQTLSRATDIGYRHSIKKSLIKTVQYVGREGVKTGINILVSKGIDEIFHRILEAVRKQFEPTATIQKSLESGALCSSFDDLVNAIIPQSLQDEDELPQSIKEDLVKGFQKVSASAVRSLVRQSKVDTLFAHSKTFVAELGKKAGSSRVQTISKIVEGAFIAKIITTMLSDMDKLAAGFEKECVTIIKSFCKDRNTRGKISNNLPNSQTDMMRKLKIDMAKVIANEYSRAMCDVLYYGLSKTLIVEIDSRLKKVTKACTQAGEKLFKLELSDNDVKACGKVAREYWRSTNVDDRAVQQFTRPPTDQRDSNHGAQLLQLEIIAKKMGIDIVLTKENRDQSTTTTWISNPQGPVSRLQLFYQADGKFYIKLKNGRTSARGSDFFIAIAQHLEKSSDNLRKLVSAEITNNIDKWGSHISRRQTMIDFYAARKQIICGHAGSSDTSYEHKQRKVHAFIKQNIIHVLSTSMNAELCLGQVTRKLQTPGPGLLEVTNKTYPSMETIRLLQQDESNLSPRLATYLKSRDKDFRPVSFDALSLHTRDSLSEKHTSVVEKLFLTKIRQDDISSALQIAFTGHFPSTVKERSSNACRDVSRKAVDKFDEVMMLDRDTVNYFRRGYLGVVRYFFDEKLLTDEEMHKTHEWVMTDQFLKLSNAEHKAIFDAIKE